MAIPRRMALALAALTVVVMTVVVLEASQVPVWSRLHEHWNGPGQSAEPRPEQESNLSSGIASGSAFDPVVPSNVAQSESQPAEGLSLSSFDRSNNENSFPDRYDSADVWRTSDSFEPAFVPSNNRPAMAPLSSFPSKGDYLKQTLVADYAPGAEKIFLMIKDGTTVLWSRLPMHLLTTLTKVPHFALYSDAAASMAGYEVVDVLANVTEQTHQSPQFQMHRRLKILHDLYGVVDGSDTTLEEGWQLDRWKNIPMLAHAYSVAPQYADWFVFMDADSYLLVDNLVELLKNYDAQQHLYMGSIAYNGPAPFAHGGSIVVLSRAALRDTVAAEPECVTEFEQRAFGHCCGDILVADMLREKLDGLEVLPATDVNFQGDTYWDLAAGAGNWCERIVSFHHLTAREVGLLWEYERMQGPQRRANLTWSDFYRDFTLPHIDYVVENWNNEAEDRVFTEDNDGGYNFWTSEEACAAACDAEPYCLSWRYSRDLKQCGLGRSIKLGRPTLPWIKLAHDQKTRDTVSGWPIDRIRAMRRTLACDPLYADSGAEGTRGEENDRTEGWHRRQLGPFEDV